jgi:hypothetical protein
VLYGASMRAHDDQVDLVCRAFMAAV